MQYLVLAVLKVKWLAAFAALVGLSIFLPKLIDPSQQDYTLRVPLESAAGLYPGSDVEIAGAKVGRIDSITLSGASALATISVDSQYTPVHKDAKVSLRPKSLLGEKYLELDPGKASATLSSGSALPRSRVASAVELQDVFNTFDQPTRDKLQIVIDELGGGFAGEGAVQNQGLKAGSQDLTDLAAVADELAQRDIELKQVISSLSVVTGELAQSDRRTQLGELIKNTEALMKTLADQDAQIQRALVETNAALTRTDAALEGTGGNLNSINHSLATTVADANQLTADLGYGMDVLMPHLDQFIAGVKAGPQVFGGYDQYGYATRIDVVALVPGPGQVAPAGPAPAPAAPALPPGSDNLGGVLGFILATPSPAAP